MIKSQLKEAKRQLHLERKELKKELHQQKAEMKREQYQQRAENGQKIDFRNLILLNNRTVVIT